MNGDRPLPSPPMVRIDSGKVRRLRESQGLTQLYVATGVEVTTDTISRWENRRYPAIKRENAVRLADALNVSLEEILQPEEELPEAATTQGPEGEHGGTAPPSKSSEAIREEGPSRARNLVRSLWPIFLLLLVALGLAWHLLGRPPQAKVVAHRLLPPYAAPGKPFPVLITVEATPPGTFSLILRETLPSGCRLFEAEPAYTSVDQITRSLSWIFQARQPRSTVAYLAELDSGTPEGAEFRFTGTVRARQGDRTMLTIEGPDLLQARYVHWTDANGDGAIDDQEILAVYDELETVGGLDYGKEEIEKLWSGGSYHWDKATREFRVD